MTQPIIISEIFGPTIQGEGPLAGLPTVFVRTGGCDFRCTWCDSMFSVDPRHKAEWQRMDEEDVLDEVVRLTRGFPILVSLSGGNPALMPLAGLIARGHDIGFTFALETQGTVERDWFASLDHLVLSPKGPSSGMRYESKRLELCIKAAGQQTQVALKFVVFGEEDYNFARGVAEAFGELPVYLQAGTPQRPHSTGKGGLDDFAYTALLRSQIASQTDWLAQRVAQDRWFDVRVGFQLHTMVWGDVRGV